LRKESLSAVRQYIAQKYGVSVGKTIAASKIEDCHVAIWNDERLLAELAKRAVTPDLITKFRLGCDNNRITIPIPNQAGFYVDIRYYSPGAKTNKFFSMQGYGGNSLYPFSQLGYNKIVIVGGEIKAIACSAVLNAHGYGCVTSTTGEGKFEYAWLQYLKGKIVYVIMDVDEPGRTASNKLCHMINSSVPEVHDILLTLDKDLFPKGGPDDFIASGGDLLKLLQDSKPWEPTDNVVDTTPKLTTLPQAFSAKESGVRLQYTGMIDCVGQSLYHVPKTIQITCDKAQPECTLCPKVAPSKDNKFVMHPESAFILETAGCTKVSQVYAVRDSLSIPQSCKAWKYDVVNRYSVEDVRLSSDMDIHNRDSEREMLPAFIVRDEEEQNVLSNATYSFVGRTWPSPRNQEAISVVSGYTLVESALESYKCRDPERLQVFQPLVNTVEGIQQKLNHIYKDLEANVTMIHQRRELHIAVDLTFHSPLFFHFDKKEQNGWVSCLLLGDTGQGKSEVPRLLISHYRQGDTVDAGTTTRAGILGGLDKYNGSHFVTWGALVQQDKRFVFIDELQKSKDSDLLGRMNDARSSGFVRLTMIQKATARARTRTLMSSNPVIGRTMSSYNYGVEAIADLCGEPQYARRFDLAVIVQKGEVDTVELQTYRPTVHHVYTSDLCHELVLWAWTIKHVEFEDERFVLNKTVEMTRKYCDDIPLVDKGSMRLKIARLAAALAARLYSVGEQTDILKVTNAHVGYIVQFLDTLYSKPAFGYADFSRVRDNENTLRNPEQILNLINQLPFNRDFVEGLRQVNTIDLNVIVDLMCASDKSEAQVMLSALLRNKAIKRQGRAYYKTGAFTDQLKKWSSNGCLLDKPNHLRGTEGVL
jgi:hypothetical protein